MSFGIGHVYGCIGAALAIILASVGSCIGVGRAGQMAGGILSKDPSKFGGLLILQLLPATQGIYGFIIAFMAMMKMGLIGGSDIVFNKYQGLSMLAVCLPIAIIGFASAIFQGKVAMTGMELSVKQEGQTGKAIIMAALVEIFAIFSFVISLIAILNIA